MTTLTPLERELLNRFQGGFPLTERPFHRVAAMLGTDETTLISLVEGMLDDGRLSRFGPLIDAERLGGRFTLAALSVPERDFERVSAILNALPQVAHNYRRDHPLNMWFVLAAPSERALNETMMRIQSLTGLPLHDFPKIQEYHLGFWIHVGADGTPGLRRWERPAALDGTWTADALDRAILAATQAGLPLHPQPYRQVASHIGCSAGAVALRLASMLAAGVVRRIGAVPNHYRLGLIGNGMSVWDISDEAIDGLGRRVGALEFVSHCYQRPRRLPIWPYNLFAMVHGRDHAEVQTKVGIIAELVGEHCRAHRVLLSTEVLKKSGLRFAA